MKLGTNLPREEAVHVDGRWNLARAVDALAAAGIPACIHNFAGDESQWDRSAKELARLLDAAGLGLLEYNSPFSIPTLGDDACEEVARQMVRLLEIAEGIGCLNVVTCAAGGDSIYPHPANRNPAAWERLRRTCGLVGEGAARKGLRARLLTEFCYPSPLATPEDAARLLDEVDSPHVQGHIDFVNCLTFDIIFDHTQHMQRAFRALGPRLRSAHIKDAQPARTYLPSLIAAPVGEGCLDLRTYLECLSHMPAAFPVAIECGGGMDVITAAYRRVKELAETLGVRVENA